jgi:hypothetical protein
VYTGKIDSQCAVDEHPYVVVAGELEILVALVLEPVAELCGRSYQGSSVSLFIA